MLALGWLVRIVVAVFALVGAAVLLSSVPNGVTSLLGWVPGVISLEHMLRPVFWVSHSLAYGMYAALCFVVCAVSLRLIPLNVRVSGGELLELGRRAATGAAQIEIERDP